MSTYAQCGNKIELKFIAIIESGNDSLALNKTDGGSRGLYQINPTGLRDYNNYHKEKFTLADLYKVKVNTEIATWLFNKRIPQLLRSYKFEQTIENKIICYNAGISFLIKKKEIPKITKNYIKKYFALCEKK